jgi:NADH dehydrogenase
MTDLVTVFGGSGFVGSQIVRALARRGLRVRVAVRRPGRAYRLPMLGDVGQIEIVQANARDAPSVERALRDADACVNAVGVLYESGAQTFEAVHAEAAAGLAQTAASHGVERFVQISAIGADAKGGAAYARTKAQGEAAVRQFIPGAVVLRPSVVFGPADAFFNRFASMAVTSPFLPLIGGGATRFQPVYVGDVAEACASALTSPVAAGGTFEIGGPAVYTFEELMRLTLAQIGRRRLLVKVSFGAAGRLGKVGDLIARTGLMAPPITTDQVELLRNDNVVGPGVAGLADLGVAATSVEAIIPTYLYRYRKGGQYAEATQAAAALAPR